MDKIYTPHKEYTVEDFQIENVIETVEGSWNGYYFDVNYSIILTKLIQSAGRFCKYYASDLFISWRCVDKDLHNAEVENKTYLFGMRKMGVDHDSYILSRRNQGYISDVYSEMYRLDITRNENKVTLTFGEIISY